jgi:hypothetical protein
MRAQENDQNVAAATPDAPRPVNSRRSAFNVKNIAITEKGACEYRDGQRTLGSDTPQFVALLQRVLYRFRNTQGQCTTCRHCGHYRRAAIPGVPVCTYCVSRSFEVDSTDLLHIATAVLTKTTTPTEYRWHPMVEVDGTRCCESCHRCGVCKKVRPDVDRTLRFCHSCITQLRDDAAAHIVVAALYYLETRRQRGALSEDLFWLNDVEMAKPSAVVEPMTT